MDKISINYISPEIGAEVITTNLNANAFGIGSWTHSMVEMNPNTIFFYTVPTTDIWEEDKVDPYGFSYEEAFIVFEKYIQTGCPTCPAGPRILCDTPGVWVHLERMKPYLSRKS